MFTSMIDLLWTHEFVRNAFLAGTMVAIIAGVIGYFVILRAQTFATDSLSHISFAGATGAIIIGLSSLIGMFVLTVLAALGIGALGHRLRGRDVETGMVLAFALGLGVLFLSIYTQGATEAVGVLFGSILSVLACSSSRDAGCGRDSFAHHCYYLPPIALCLRRS